MRLSSLGKSSVTVVWAAGRAARQLVHGPAPPRGGSRARLSSIGERGRRPALRLGHALAHLRACGAAGGSRSARAPFVELGDTSELGRSLVHEQGGQQTALASSAARPSGSRPRRSGASRSASMRASPAWASSARPRGAGRSSARASGRVQQQRHEIALGLARRRPRPMRGGRHGRSGGPSGPRAGRWASIQSWVGSTPSFRAASRDERRPLRRRCRPWPGEERHARERAWPGPRPVLASVRVERPPDRAHRRGCCAAAASALA